MVKRLSDFVNPQTLSSRPKLVSKKPELVFSTVNGYFNTGSMK